jgi:hypothetical protein
MDLIYHSKATSPVRVTVLARIEGNTAKFGVSRCSRHDQFVKKTGRTIAEGRALRNPFRQTPVPNESLSHWFIANAQEIEAEVIFNPDRLHKRPLSYTQRVKEYLKEMIGI